MADKPASSSHSSPGSKLTTALSDFASSYVRKELQQLIREQDDALARSHVPKLRALLREIDKERQAFEQDKESLIHRLRKKLDLLEVDAVTVEAAVAELKPLVPKYLSIIPSASTLTVRPPTPYMSPVRDTYFHTVLGADVASNLSPPSLPPLDQPPSTPIKTSRSSQTDVNFSPKAVAGIDPQLQDQVMAESSVPTQSLKRPSNALGNESQSGGKRQRVEGIKSSIRVAQSDISRKIAFPNLETGECIFRHSDRSGFFVIRCNRANCKSGFFTEPPLAYNRALKHFQRHGENGPDGEDLTNEYIFEQFACQIEGSNMVSKYWIKEHLGASPHTFTPGKSRPKASQADALSGVQKQEENDEDYTPSARAQDSVSMNGSEVEVEAEVEVVVEKLRRTPRSVQRPDYAELVANKDPWNSADAESDRVTPRVSKEARTSATSDRKPSKANSSRSSSTSKTSTPVLVSAPKAKTTESSKYVSTRPDWMGPAQDRTTRPFGYTSEQWPRRSAPR
ncbi:hypothetical protein F4779DRAFT_631867 [Xylariaceae sp. FL0662B]|nr:hypothetical protein F4779DRAFT_631867 [Xylariaceae sp. FL0662B]